MCTYQTTIVDIDASGKTASGWQRLNQASVYVDHPVHFASNHAVMIDVINPLEGAQVRVALEMDAESARALAEAILTALGETPEAILDDTKRVIGLPC
jgi:hypothetical protein